MGPKTTRQQTAQAGPGSVAPARTYLLSLPWDPEAIGGVNQVVAGLYDGIKRDGRLAPRIHVASWHDVQSVEGNDSAGRDTVRARIRAPFGSRQLVPGLVRYLLALPFELWRMRRLVRRYAVEIVNCHYIGSSELTWAIAKRLGAYRGKVILSLHGQDLRNLATLTGVRRAAWRWALRAVDAVVACSDALAVEAAAAFGLPASCIVTIHNGVDVSELTRLAAATSAPPEAPDDIGPALLNLGTFEHKKGHDLLLRAFRQVVDRYPNAHLKIMGRRAETMESTLRLVDELGLAGHTSIRADAPHPDALQALRDADVFVLSSRNEAFSMALLEAGVFAKPVVATDVCGVAELVQDGVTGVRIPPEDVDALSAGMCRLLADRDAARLFGQRLRDRVCSRFTREEVCRKYLRLAGYQSPG